MAILGNHLVVSKCSISLMFKLAMAVQNITSQNNSLKYRAGWFLDCFGGFSAYSPPSSSSHILSNSSELKSVTRFEPLPVQR